MAYQSEAALEQQFIEQLNKQEYSTVDIPDYDALVENFKVQFEAFNAPKLDTPITDKEWERIFNLMLYSRQKTDREVVSVLNDVDFCIEIMESDRINVAYIMNLIRNIHFDDKKQKDYDIKHIKEELSRTDNPQLLRKVEILQAFLDRVVVGLESADEIDAAYNDFENEAKREEIVAFAKTEDIDSSMLTDIISEYEFSGTMDAGNIRDRIEKPMPLLKKRSLVNRIVEFIRQHTEKYQ